jgi:hypothetical protein
MHTLAAEFQEVLCQYLKLTEAIKQIVAIDESQDSQALVRSIIDNQDYLMKIQQMDARVLELSERLKRSQKELNATDYAKIKGVSNAVTVQALHIREQCRLLEQRVQSRRDQLAKELQEINKGSRYLKVLKPTQTNFPKFIDSTC